ncbi:MAG: hypothetical protein HC884_05655 [Chloroflexaceae bacterium]|nr:hypothetical protein [Chloroflexaceae bacterium]
MVGNPFVDYRTDMLILLMGENPLPNYVAACLLADTSTRLLLVHSGVKGTGKQVTKGTGEQCDRLKKVLQAKGYTFGPDDTVEVEESNPANIWNEITSKIKGHTGSIGLNYTGGTKAMSVHAYRAVEQAKDRQKRYYSYLDARSLSMWFTDESCNAWSERVKTLVPVTLLELLALHGLEKLKQEPDEKVRWPETTKALLDLHTDAERQKVWRDWYNLRKFNELQGPNAHLSTDEFPQTIREALQCDNPTLAFPGTFGDLVIAGDFKPKEREKRTVGGVCGKWFTSTWLEEHVFRQVQEIQSEQGIHDVKMSIEPDLGPDDSFEFDVAFMRGHQLFGLSCSAMEKKAPLKEKLLEVAVRASQLGGGETCFALVCCAEGDNLRDLKYQLARLC